jgi:hypothetical protein
MLILIYYLGKSVCVDNTNTDVNVRAKWVALAKSHQEKTGVKVVVRCIVLKVPKETCFALAAFRLLDPTTRPEDKRRIDKIVIHTHFKNFSIPTVAEGFSRVDCVHWKPVLPDNPIAIKLFQMHIL